MRNPYDFYPTPRDTIVSIVSFLAHDKTWHECAAGDGAIVRVLEEHGHKVTADDIRTTKIDFLKDTTYREGIITNPPFLWAFQFVQHAVRHSPEVIMLLPLNFLASQMRADWFKKNEPDSLFVLSKRPCFTNDGKTDSKDYAWFYWGPNYKGIFHV